MSGSDTIPSVACDPLPHFDKLPTLQVLHQRTTESYFEHVPLQYQAILLILSELLLNQISDHLMDQYDEVNAAFTRET